MRLSVMRYSWLLWLIIFGISEARADPIGQTWTLVKASGEIHITGIRGNRLQTRVGTHLQPPFRVTTGNDGHVVVSRGIDKLSIGPNTRSTVARPTRTASGLITRIKQTLGSVLYHDQHRVKDSFEVDTPYLVSVVKGTTFNIHVTPDASTVVLVEGHLLVSTPDRKYKLMLKPGQAAIKSKLGQGIIVKDQQALSDPVRGPITIVKEGKRPVSILPAPGEIIPVKGLKEPLVTDVANTVTMKGITRADGIANITGGPLIDVGTNTLGASTNAALGGAGVASVGASVPGISSTATIGGGGTLSVGASVPGVSATTSVGGGAVANLGASVPGVSTSATIGDGGTVNLDASVPGVSTTTSTIGTTITNVTKPTSSSAVPLLGP